MSCRTWSLSNLFDMDGRRCQTYRTESVCMRVTSWAPKPLNMGARNESVSYFYRAIHYSIAVLRLHVARPSVRPSVTLVDQDHIG